MKFLYRFLLVFFFLVWLGGMYLVFTTTQDGHRAVSITKWLARYAANPYFIVLFIGGIASIMIIFWWPTWTQAYRQNRLYKRLKKEGVVATVPIIHIFDTRVTVNKNPRIAISVRILDREAEFEVTVSRLSIPQVGDLIEVLYDPKNPTLAVPVLH
ncbi:MAG: hypothetical protein ACKOWL_06815 [Sphingobacteriaceae bacterium]